MIGQLSAEIYFPTETLLEFHKENGLHEWLQFGFLCGVFILSCKTLLQMDRRKNIWLTVWMAAATLGSLYVAGEEISWGQWIFHWQTPEEWAAINGQNETNLHNTSKWLNQKPRAILEIGILIGGIIIPAVKYFKPAWFPNALKLFIRRTF